MTGIDGSPLMLAYARANAPAASFMAADARYFGLRRRFDAVISTFESINHIVDANDLGLVFSNVASVLAPGGLFFFDLLTEQAYRDEWTKSSAVVEEDAVCILRGGYEPQTAIAHADITAFRRLAEVWKRADVTILERCYSLEWIRSALGNAGFVEIHDYDAASAGMAGSLAAGRKFVIAHHR
jgi:SAM-dependent methyltransferase